MDKPEIEFVCELQRLQLKEGDRFVMTFDGALSRAALYHDNRKQEIKDDPQSHCRRQGKRRSHV